MIYPWNVRGPLTACHHCVQTLSIDHMLLGCVVLQECCQLHSWLIEYSPRDNTRDLHSGIPAGRAGFFYLIWCNLLTSTSPQTWTMQSGWSNFFQKWKQLWDTFTCVGRLICPKGRVSSLNKPNPIQSTMYTFVKIISSGIVTNKMQTLCCWNQNHDHFDTTW